MSGETEAPLPQLGHFMELHAAGGRSSLGRVQEASAARIVVALPSDAAVAPAGQVGDAFELVWPGPGGVRVESGTLRARHGGPQLELWEFAPTGDVRFEQRRHDRRVPAGGPITVTVAGGGAPLSGTLVDLSAAAVRCLLGGGADDVVVAGGTRVRCGFTLDGAAVSLEGVVHAAWTEGAPPSIRVVVQFDPGQSGLGAIAEHVAANLAVARQDS